MTKLEYVTVKVGTLRRGSRFWMCGKVGRVIKHDGGMSGTVVEYEAGQRVFKAHGETVTIKNTRERTEISSNAEVKVKRPARLLSGLF